MISYELQEILASLDRHGKMSFPAPATAAQLRSFEEAHNIFLPSQLREWLSVHDGGEFFLPAGAQLFGVAHKPLIDVNDTDRPDRRYIVIGAMAWGDPILMERNSPRISIYNHEAARIESDEVYGDFFTFLKDLYSLLGLGD